MAWIRSHMQEQGGDGLPALKRWSLRFADEDWDDRYRGALRESNLKTLRIAFVLAILLSSLFVPMDTQFYPENGETIAVWRALGVNALFALVIALSYLPFWRTRWPALLMLGAVGYTIFQSWANVYGAHLRPTDHGFILMIFIIYALLPFFYIQAVIAALICSTLYIAITVIFAGTGANADDTAYSVMLLIAANIIGFFALRGIESLRRRSFAASQLVDEERARARELLDRILPASVAARLREGESTVVEELADVTVLFADVEGFTSMAADCAPEDTLKTLSSCFERFDQLVRVHQVEKIKTIGDAYMVAAGAPKGASSDAHHIAALALDMLKAVQDLKRPDGKPLQIRIGMARGAIIAGVVGDSRFLYDLWGDAVNTASRMETTGEAGRIQVTEDVVSALNDIYAFEPRGEVEVKGKGLMPTWWLAPPEPAPAE